VSAAARRPSLGASFKNGNGGSKRKQASKDLGKFSSGKVLTSIIDFYYFAPKYFHRFENFNN